MSYQQLHQQMASISRGALPDTKSATPMWLDCDTGHDDAFAILVAAHSPDVRLVGISTVYGNAPLSKTTYNTRAILRAIGREDIPVYAGAEKPSIRATCFAPDIHGETGLDGTMCLPRPHVGAKTDVSAVEAMHAALSGEEAGKAWLVATGSLTNIAVLFTLHPEMANHIAGLTIMGGAVGGGFTDAPLGTVDNEERFGNWTPYAEFNMYCDPEAAATVFNNAILAAKTTLIPLDLTHQFLATSQIRNSLLFGASNRRQYEVTMASISPVRRLYYEIVNFFAQTYADVFGLKDGPPTHDPLAVFAAFRPSLFQASSASSDDDDAEGHEERFAVTIVLEGEHGSTPEVLNGPSKCGQTVVSKLAPGKSGVRVPRSLATHELWQLIEDCLASAERVSKKHAAASRRTEQLSNIVTEHSRGLPRPEAVNGEGLSPTLVKFRSGMAGINNEAAG